MPVFTLQPPGGFGHIHTSSWYFARLVRTLLDLFNNVTSDVDLLGYRRFNNVHTGINM